MQCYDRAVQLWHSLAHGLKGRSGSDRPVVCVMICVPAVTSVCLKKGRREGAQLRRRRGGGDGVDRLKKKRKHTQGEYWMLSQEKCSRSVLLKEVRALKLVRRISGGRKPTLYC